MILLAIVGATVLLGLMGVGIFYLSNNVKIRKGENK